MKTSLVLALLLTAAIASAQDRWHLEFRAGGSFATEDFGNATLRTGFGLEGTLSYSFMPQLSAYAGWGWNRMPSEPTSAGEKLDYEETGYTAGIQFINPIGESTLSYKLGAGAVFNHVEVENNAGDRIADTGHGFGWQVEAGLQIPVSQSLTLTPGLRYRSLPRETRVGGVTSTANLSYISAGVGFAWAL